LTIANHIKTIGIEEYHAGPGVSKSDLDLIARSPAHYRAQKAAPREATPAMIIGSAFHTATLEPEKFDLEFAVAPEGIDRRTKAGKEEWAAFEAASAGKTVLKAEDADRVKEMALAVLAHPLAGPLVRGGVAERSLYWEPSVVEGIVSKCRPDYVKSLDEGHYVVVDLKSTEDARPWAFERSAWNYRYHVQAAYYWDGCTDALGHAPDAFVFIAVEKAPPYAVVVYEASVEMMGAGREEYFRNLRTFKECLDSGEWPAYPVEIMELMPPKWAV